MRRLAILLVILVLPRLGFGAETEEQGGYFRDGERVAVIGDSITAWGQWVAIVHLFYQTRYPQRKIVWFNNALAGDQAPYSKLRAEPEGDVFASDILRNRPTSAMIMLGMNDARNASIWSQPPKVLAERRDRAAEDYRSSMDEMIGKLKANGVEQFVLVISSPYDETTETKREKLVGKNGFIRKVTGPYLGEKTEDLENAILIDLNTPMMAVNQREQISDPAFSLADLGDRVHPLKVGHSAMAFFALQGMGFDSQVAELEIDAASANSNAKVVVAENCEVTGLHRTDSGIRFDYVAKALPFPAAEFSFGEWVSFDAELNQEILRVEGLDAAPRYDLSIDGESVATYSAAELAKGINLAINPKTPQYQQALRVSKLNARSWLAGNSKRHLIGTLRLMRIRKLDTVEAQLEYMRGRKVPAAGVGRQRHEEFLKVLEDGSLEQVVVASIQRSAEFNDQAYRTAKPVSRSYLLKASQIPEGAGDK